MSAPHLLIDPAAIDGSRAVLDDAESHHLVRVLRRGVGDDVSVADGHGRLWHATIEALGPPVVVELANPVDVPPSRPALTVVHAVPSGRKLDDVVRRLSELGVDRLQPVVSERTENRPTRAKASKQVDRWRSVAHAAAKQARRARPLAVDDVAAWPGALAGADGGAVLWEEAEHPLSAVLPEPATADEVALGIGPEGGLTGSEVDRAALPAAGLGSTVLRTETAAVAACAVVLHRAGRFA